ncbi:Glycolipid anchored surface protein 4 precursor [Elasticomyces elasticus]|nr:Glycolipid anchored surface protein 4 precursor [Elasticomyces elasticus]
MLPFTALAAFFLPPLASAVNPLVVSSQNFADSLTHDRFVIIGVDYQPGGQGAFNPTNTVDPLSNGTLCLRDAALMQKLGINTIRWYNVDPALNHDECASIFNEIGIYMIVDVNSPLAGQSIDRGKPSSSYTLSYLEHIFSVVESLRSYPNTLGFFAGNEIINDIATAQDNPPYIRAVQKDIKEYIANHAGRTIPVGYSAADVREVLQDTWAYLQCSTSGSAGNDTSRSDFFGLNSYSWCGSSATFESSRYSDLVSTFSNTTIPVFFSEYGCNNPAPRVFDEVQALYGPQMTIMSGGLVYEFSQEVNNFGLVSLYGNGTAQLLGDYDNLQRQYNQLNLSSLKSTNRTATSLVPPTCNSSLITNKGFSTDFKIPRAPSGAAAVIANGISKAPTGSIVSIPETSVPLAVYASNGGLINGLGIKPVQGANSPSGQDMGAIASASSSSSASPTTGGSASGTGGESVTSVGAGAVSTEGVTLAMAVFLGAAAWII